MANDTPVRLLDRPLPPSLPLGSALAGFGGIGLSTLRVLVGCSGLSPALPLAALTPAQLRLLEAGLRRRHLGRSLVRFRLARIGEKRRCGVYPGVRHAMGLPVRGQRTHSNGRTARRVSSSLPSL